MNTFPHQAELADLIHHLALRFDEFFTLSKPVGGKKVESNTYCNLRPVLCSAAGGVYAGRALLHALQPSPPSFVIGPADTAILLVGHVINAAFHQPPQGALPKGLWLPKSAKQHGEKVAFQGLPRGQSLKGQNVVVLEDTSTTGGSALQVVDALQAAEANVLKVITVLDREEGAAEACAGKGIRFQSLFTLKQFLPPGYQVITRPLAIQPG